MKTHTPHIHCNHSHQRDQAAADQLLFNVGRPDGQVPSVRGPLRLFPPSDSLSLYTVLIHLHTRAEFVDYCPLF